jgi:hypothetical protein
MPDLEVHTLLPDGEVGRGGGGVADANDALFALRDDDEDDCGGGVWGENLEDGDIGGGGGGCCSGLMEAVAVDVEAGDAEGPIIACDVGRGPPPPPPPPTPDDMVRYQSKTLSDLSFQPQPTTR